MNLRGLGSRTFHLKFINMYLREKFVFINFELVVSLVRMLKVQRSSCKMSVTSENVVSVKNNHRLHMETDVESLLNQLIKHSEQRLKRVRVFRS